MGFSIAFSLAAATKRDKKAFAPAPRKQGFVFGRVQNLPPTPNRARYQKSPEGAQYNAGAYEGADLHADTYDRPRIHEDLHSPEPENLARPVPPPYVNGGSERVESSVVPLGS